MGVSARGEVMHVAGKKSARQDSQDQGLFRKPRWKKYARIVTFENPDAAKGAARELLREFRNAKTRAKKVRVKKVTVYAANRARASAKRKSLSSRERRELLQIARIYERAAAKMKLPPKR